MGTWIFVSIPYRDLDTLTRMQGAPSSVKTIALMEYCQLPTGYLAI